VPSTDTVSGVTKRFNLLHAPLAADPRTTDLGFEEGLFARFQEFPGRFARAQYTAWLARTSRELALTAAETIQTPYSDPPGVFCSIRTRSVRVEEHPRLSSQGLSTRLSLAINQPGPTP
jgi:hypothetical protein